MLSTTAAQKLSAIAHGGGKGPAVQLWSAKLGTLCGMQHLKLQAAAAAVVTEQQQPSLVLLLVLLLLRGSGVR
jgi:hypothetical protein